MPLPTPVGKQKEVLYLPAEGHFVVLGTAGSGKTTLAILRSAYLADPDTDHCGPTLLVTFNLALVAYLRHLQDRELEQVIVENYHKFARGYLHSRGKMRPNGICDNDLRKALVQQAVAKVAADYEPHPLFEKNIEVLVDEISWMSKHGIYSTEAYEAVERIGRTGVRIERRLRPIMFKIFHAYRSLRADSGKDYDWDDLSSAVCQELDLDTTERRYRHIVIDEGQDFSPEMVRSLVKAIPKNGSITFFGDIAQQIYGHSMSWKSAGLRITSVWEFRDNFRNTKQIAKLALAISAMPYFRDVQEELVEPTSPTADGPLPTIVRCSSIQREIGLAVSQAKTASTTLSVAILLRKRRDEEMIKGLLPRNSVRLDRDMTTWQAGPGIRYGTYHAAKGLEFDMIILPFCSKDRLPDPEAVDTFGVDEAIAEDGRLLYVGTTRAKTRLIMTYNGELTDLLPVDHALYERVNL